MKKIIITGSGGFLGANLYSFLKNNGYSVCGLGRTKKNNVDVICDLSDPAQVKNTISQVNPDCIIHCAKLAKSLDYCELNPKENFDHNYQTTLNIVKTIKNSKIYFIYISTDYIFDGKKGNYKDDDYPHPLSLYALAKLMGEEVTKTLDSFLILRPTQIYGWDKNGMNFFMQLYRSLTKKEPMKVPNDQIGNPTYVKTLIKTILLCLQSELKGAYNCCGKESIDRYEYALKIARSFGLETNLIKSISTSELNQIALRPLNCSVNSDKLQKVLGFEFPTIESTFTDIKEEMAKNKEI